MLFEEVLIFILALSVPAAAIFAFRAGYKAGKAVREGADLPPVVELPQKKEPRSAEQEKLDQIWANIDSYDGTSKGQVKING